MDRNVIAIEDNELLDLIKRIQLLHLFGINNSDEKYYELLNRSVKIRDLYSRLAFLDECGTVKESGEQIEIMCMSKGAFAEKYGSLVEGVMHKISPQQRQWLYDSFGIFAYGDMDYQKVVENLSEDQVSEMVTRILEYAYPYENEPGRTGIKDNVDSLAAVYYAKILEEYPEGLKVSNKNIYDMDVIRKLETLFNAGDGHNVPTEIQAAIAEGDKISEEIQGDIIRADELIAQHTELKNSILEIVESVLEAMRTIVASSGDFDVQSGNSSSSEVSLRNDVEVNTYRKQAKAFIERLTDLLKKNPELIKYDPTIVYFSDSRNSKDTVRYYPFRVKGGNVILEPIGICDNATYIIPEEKYDEYIQKEKFPRKKELRANKENAPVVHGSTQILTPIVEYIKLHPEEREKFEGKRLYDFNTEHFFAIVEYLATMSHDGINAKNIREAINAKVAEMERIALGAKVADRMNAIVHVDDTRDDNSQDEI